MKILVNSTIIVTSQKPDKKLWSDLSPSKMLTLILVTVLTALVYYYLIKPASYWADKDIPHIKAWPLVGNMWDALTQKKHFFEVTNEIYKSFPNERYVGYKQFGTSLLLIRDLDLIKQIGVKDFDSFPDHQHNANVDIDPVLSKTLLHLHGDKWKQMRATLSPAFTSSKMKNMYRFMGECAGNLATYIGKGQEDVEIKELMSRFTNDVIATTAFGLQVDAVKDPQHEFYVMGQKLTDFRLSQMIKVILVQASVTLAKILNTKVLPVECTDFFYSIIKSNINKRIKENIVRPDLIHLLLEAKKGKLKHENTEEKTEGFAAVEESHIGKKTIEFELTDDHIAAQALLFFFAGFETVSTASSFMAYELAIHPEIQKKLQKEIDEVKKQHPGQVPYEALLSMKYLDQVVSESLRKWPPAMQTDRYCAKEFVIPPTKPTEKTFVLEKGISVSVPIYAIHHDPQYFPEPDKFDPERFNDENKSKIVSGSYLPFGIGPRNCIGSRFALLEVKTLFLHLLAKFDLVANAKTEIPLRISPKKATVCPENGIHLGFKLRSSA